MSSAARRILRGKAPGYNPRVQRPPSVADQVVAFLQVVFESLGTLCGILLALYLIFFALSAPVAAVLRKRTFLKISAAYLYAAPVFLIGLAAAGVIFHFQAAIVFAVFREATNPSAALTRALHQRIQEERPSLLEEARERLEGEPFHVAEILHRNVRSFAESRYYPPTQWSIRAVHDFLRFYDAAFHLVILAAMVTMLFPLAVDALGHPFRRVRAGEPVRVLFQRVGKRVLGMVIFLVLGGAVYLAYAAILGLATELLTLVAAQILADATLDTARAAATQDISPFAVFFHALCFSLFILAFTTTLALSIFAVTAGTGAALRARIDRRLFGRPVPTGYRELAKRHALFLGKLFAALLFQYAVVRILFGTLPIQTALVGVAAANLIIVPLVLLLFRAFCDLRSLFRNAVALHRPAPVAETATQEPQQRV
jgi:hypothetical protein